MAQHIDLVVEGMSNEHAELFATMFEQTCKEQGWTVDGQIEELGADEGEYIWWPFSLLRKLRG